MVAGGVWREGTDAAKVPAPVLPSRDRRLPTSGFSGSGQHNQIRHFPPPIRRGVGSAARWLRCSAWRVAFGIVWIENVYDHKIEVDDRTGGTTNEHSSCAEYRLHSAHCTVRNGRRERQAGSARLGRLGTTCCSIDRAWGTMLMYSTSSPRNSLLHSTSTASHVEDLAHPAILTRPPQTTLPIGLVTMCWR